MEERERWLEALDAITEGMADIKAGDVHDAEDVFAELEAELSALPERATA